MLEGYVLIDKTVLLTLLSAGGLQSHIYKIHVQNLRADDKDFDCHVMISLCRL